MMGQIIRKADFETVRRKLERERQIQQEQTRIPERYAGDIRRFSAYCVETGQGENVEAMLDYLYVSLTVQRVKKTTWERRLAAVKKYLSVVQGLTVNEEEQKQLTTMRAMFKREEYAEQVHMQGQTATDKTELVEMIDKMDTRARAICLVNLLTANRPSEMVRMKIGDFDLPGRSVRVYLKKQKEWQHKRLTLEVVKVVKQYIKEYQLTKDDYFVGRTFKSGRYESREVGEVAYNKMVQKWLGFAPYTLRKTQVSSMHEKGADLPTIAKQTGHRSLEVLSRHYLKVNDKTVDKFL